VIYEVIRKHGIQNCVFALCKEAKVSRSGYYDWLKNIEKHAIRENNDYEDYLFLKCIYDAFKGKTGYRGLYMKVCELLETPMNPKKIRRLMRKYNFFAKIRRANPYKNIAKATQEHKTFPNILNRGFIQDEPGKVFLTDITYLKYQGRTAYLSCVKDVATREIMAYELSSTLKMSIVYNTLTKLNDKLDGIIHPEAMIHSDQGFHYTHPEFQKRVGQMNLKQSMSRRGNCIDNAPMESFFGHMKDELDYKQARTFEELKEMTDQYMIYYNESRRQWNLKKMTPIEYRSHLIVA
jgi:putative transposase